MKTLYLIFCFSINFSSQSIYNQVKGQDRGINPEIDLIELQGWDKYLDDEVSEVHNIPLTWERGDQIPSWLRGSFIKNGPSQKKFDSEDR